MDTERKRLLDVVLSEQAVIIQKLKTLYQAANALNIAKPTLTDSEYQEKQTVMFTELNLLTAQSNNLMKDLEALK